MTFPHLLPARQVTATTWRVIIERWKPQTKTSLFKKTCQGIYLKSTPNHLTIGRITLNWHFKIQSFSLSTKQTFAPKYWKHGFCHKSPCKKTVIKCYKGIIKVFSFWIKLEMTSADMFIFTVSTFFVGFWSVWQQKEWLPSPGFEPQTYCMWSQCATILPRLLLM